LKPDEIRVGVICTKCNDGEMKKILKVWVCATCNHMDRNAHELTIKEYALLFHNWFSNQEIKKFLNLQSPSITGKLLSRMELKSTGETKARKYYYEIKNL
jgi:hypothetical protein